MQIATWNLGYWQFKRHHAEAWAYLRDEMRPDIALLQEVCPPTLGESESIVFKEIHRSWGTAVYARDMPLDQVSIRTYPGRVAAALARSPSGRVIYVASIHAPIINNRVFPHLSKIFDEIINAFSERTAIVGGDLNSARLAEIVWPGYGHGPFWERVEGGPFFDCHRKFHPEEVQTFFRPSQIHPFQDDHIFASENLAESVTACEVIHNDLTRKVSDHIPVVAEISI